MADHPDDIARTHTRDTHLACARRAADAAAAADVADDDDEHQHALALLCEADDAACRAEVEATQLRAGQQRRRALLAHTLSGRHPGPPAEILSRGGWPEL